MKKKIYTSLLTIFLAVAMISAGIYQKLKGPHGGVVKEAGKYVIEFKNTGSEIYAYLLTNKSKPLSNEGISCVTRFYFADGTCMDATLTPYEKDGFTTSSAISNFNSCRVTFSVRNEKFSSIFDNVEVIVLGR